MKKLFFITLLSLCALTSNAQKKRSTKSAKPKNEILAKLDDVSAEIITINKERNLVLFIKNGVGVDTLKMKVVDKAFKPSNFVLKPIMVKNTKLYVVTWNETILEKTKTKVVNANVTESQIMNPVTNAILIGNTQKDSHIKETVFLDANKTASHEVEKNRKEGFQFVLNDDGTLILKTKTQENHYAYNPTTDKYEPTKAVVTAKKSNSKNKKRR